MRRSLLRVLRPYSAYQQSVDSRVLDAIDDLERRLREQERMQLGVVTEDLLEALGALRSRIADIEDVAAGTRALPYMAPGSLEQFSDPSAGVVLGYRDGGGKNEAAYVGFEEAFRGSEDRVRERQRGFLELLRDHTPVLDAGCGRGEFLDLLRENGVEYTGVDVDVGMVEHCRAKGHEGVELKAANEYLERLPDGELGSIFCAQMIEHLPYDELRRLLRLSLEKLRPGGLLVAETVNPHAPHGLKTFWVDPTHKAPIFPEVALHLCRLTGFGSAFVFHPNGTRNVEVDRYREGEYAVVATR